MNTSSCEEQWERDRLACWQRFIARVVAWLQMEDADEKRQAVKQCIAEYGEGVARESVNAVLKIKTKTARLDIASELPRMTPSEQEAFIRKTLRAR